MDLSGAVCETPAASLTGIPTEILSTIISNISDDERIIKGVKIVLCLTSKQFLERIYEDLDFDAKYKHLLIYIAYCDGINLMTWFDVDLAKSWVQIRKTAYAHDSINLITRYNIRSDDCTGLFERGKLDIIRLVHTFIGRFDVPKYARLAIINGHVEVFRWLYANYKDMFNDTLIGNLYCQAARHSMSVLLEVINILPAAGGLSSRVLVAAICRGNIDIANLCIASGIQLSEIELQTIFSGTADHAQLDAMKLVYRDGIIILKEESRFAAKHSHTELLDWLREIGQLDHDSMILGFIDSGDTSHFPGGIPQQYITDDGEHRVITDNNLEMIKLLWHGGQMFRAYNFITAANDGYWDAAIFAVDNKIISMYWIVIAAARLGCISMLQYAVNTGYTLPHSLCNRAAKYGRNTALKWLHDHGCQWDETTCEIAVRNKRRRTFRLLLEWGCPCDSRRVLQKSKLRNLTPEYGYQPTGVGISKHSQ